LLWEKHVPPFGNSLVMGDTRENRRRDIFTSWAPRTLPKQGCAFSVDHVGTRRPIHPEYVAATLDELAGPGAIRKI
jgi:hypothetical protein